MTKTRREFLQSGATASAGLLVSAAGRANAQGASAGRYAGSRPNIVFILADDMGFSDIGCYGSEIDTPNLDSLAKGGLQFTDFHNSPRCCPSRAALLTGLYSHQAGMGMMTADYGRYPYPAYRGDLSENCVTIAEALRPAGYNTLMVGKWHLTPLTVGQHNYPFQRGFNRYYGIINGAASYFDPASLTQDNTPITVPSDQHDYYLTDAFGDNAVQYIEEAAAKRSTLLSVRSVYRGPLAADGAGRHHCKVQGPLRGRLGQAPRGTACEATRSRHCTRRMGHHGARPAGTEMGTRLVPRLGDAPHGRLRRADR